MPNERRGSNEHLQDEVKEGEVDDLVTKMIAVSGTSLVFAGSIMAWLNSYLSKLIPHRDMNNAEEDHNNGELYQQYPDNIIIPYKTLELVFIGLASSGVAVLLGTAFMAYHFTRKFRCLKRMIAENKANSTKKFRHFQSRSRVVDIFMGIGVFAGFLSVAFSILLFHTKPFMPFLCFLIPLPVCIIVTIVISLVIFR